MKWKVTVAGGGFFAGGSAEPAGGRRTPPPPPPPGRGRAARHRWRPGPGSGPEGGRLAWLGMRCSCGLMVHRMGLDSIPDSSVNCGPGTIELATPTDGLGCFWSAVTCPLYYPQVGVPTPPIPKGLRPPAQGCEARATLGMCEKRPPTPTGLCLCASRCGRNPVGVETHSIAVTQGSSLLATLGFVAESRWDSTNHVADLWVIQRTSTPKSNYSVFRGWDQD